MSTHVLTATPDVVAAAATAPASPAALSLPVDTAMSLDGVLPTHTPAIPSPVIAPAGGPDDHAVQHTGPVHHSPTPHTRVDGGGSAESEGHVVYANANANANVNAEGDGGMVD